MIICLRDAIIDAHESESCIGHAPHGEAYGGLGFRVPVRSLKLKPLLQCEILIQIGIKQTKLHASIQHLACTISMISANVGHTAGRHMHRPQHTADATRAHVRKT